MEGTKPEVGLWERLSVALGEPLEAVWRMPDEERSQLIKVMNLDNNESPAVEETERPLVYRRSLPPMLEVPSTSEVNKTAIGMMGPMGEDAPKRPHPFIVSLTW